jgi:hypothetical protein
MVRVMKKSSDYNTRKGVVMVHDLSFLSDRNHSYGWLRRHYRHHRLRLALRRAKNIIAGNEKVAIDITRYYFIPKERINILQNQEQLR